jgi:hypothetical protein
MRKAKIDAKDAPARISDDDILLEDNVDESGCVLIGVALFIRQLQQKNQPNSNNNRVSASLTMILGTI